MYIFGDIGNSEIKICLVNSKKKIIKANKLNSYGCFILGDDEMKENKILWKNMESGKQRSILIDKINDFIKII